ncbi:site-specific integrase [Sorangium sp. So ce134]
MTEPTQRRGRGRPRTGSVERHGDHWDVRPTLADGSRGDRVCQPPGMSEAKAREKARALTELAQREGVTRAPAAVAVAPAGPTFEAWSEAWCDDRKRRGLASVADNRANLRNWVLPRLDPPLGSRPMVSIESSDLEQFVEDLDARVRAGELAWKTAKNIWMLVAKAFKDAVKAKTLALRVRKDNPALNVAGPDEGVRRAKSYLYPSEFLALMNCAAVPLRWRRLVALHIYTYARAGEVEALHVEDVDLRHRVLHVHRAIDRKRGGIKEVKTNQPRRFSIEPELMPLLEVLVADARAAGDVRLVAVPPLHALAPRLRKYLQRAGVTRAELFADDATRKRLTWHDLRSTGITWAAIRGDEPLHIMHRAGHEQMSTTMEYVREAESVEFLREEVFPPLPAELFLPGILPDRGRPRVQTAAIAAKFARNTPARCRAST